MRSGLGQEATDCATNGGSLKKAGLVQADLTGWAKAARSAAIKTAAIQRQATGLSLATPTAVRRLRPTEAGRSQLLGDRKTWKTGRTAKPGRCLPKLNVRNAKDAMP